MVSNHRIVGDGNDWMRDVERRVGRQERRPAPVDVKAVFGTAINQRARQIADWNDPEALRNGWYYTETFGIHSPDPDYMWMGECIVTYDGHGTQVLWSHGAPVLYQFVRTFHWHENEAPDFGDWLQVYPVPNTDTAWITPTLTNNWAHYSTTVQYRRMTGLTHLRGTTRNGTQFAPAFNLPVGFRPGQDLRIANWGSATATNVSGIYIQTNGDVTPYWNTLGTGGEHSIDGISFIAEG